MQSKKIKHEKSLGEGEAQQKSYFPLLDFCSCGLWVDTTNASIGRVCRNPLSLCKGSQAWNPVVFSSRTCRVVGLNI